MKVYIGPYKNWIGPYQIADKIFFWVERHGIFPDDDPRWQRWDYKAAEKLGDWLAESWVNKFCNWIHSKHERNVKVRIDHYDTWSMDHTLSHIIHPMLVQLKATKHGSNWVDDEDVPEHLRSTAAPPLTEEENRYHASDALMHDRWDWILDELIWTFYAIKEDDEFDFFGDNKFDDVAYKKHHDRIMNGLRLFGKYYQGLWD
jgi:hypothetical protein